MKTCPYCHNEIPFKKYKKYIWLGTKYPTKCDHCGRELYLEKEPIPFLYCVFAGFMSIYLPMQYFLYYCKYGFWESAGYSMIIFIPMLVIGTIIYLKNIKFK